MYRAVRSVPDNVSEESRSGEGRALRTTAASLGAEVGFQRNSHQQGWRHTRVQGTYRCSQMPGSDFREVRGQEHSPQRAGCNF